MTADETPIASQMATGRLALSPPPGAGWQPSVPRLAGSARRLVYTHAFRLAALYFLVFAASMLAILAFVYWTSADFVERQTEATLDAEVSGLAEQYAQRGLSGLVQLVAARSAGDRGDNMFYLVTAPDGMPLAGNISGWPADVPAHSGWLSFRIATAARGRSETDPARGAVFVIPGGYRLLVARDIGDAAAFRDRVKTTLIWAGLVALGVGLLGGAVMSRNLLRRVELVNRTSERVMSGNLAERVPLRGSGDEFDQLAANLNRMLDQIERLMTAMREVTDDVAHDLKTPLARLRARLELALIGSDAGDGRQGEAIRAAIDEADRLLATFNALLGIAEAEAGGGLRRMTRLDLAEIARTAVEFYEPLAEERGFRLLFEAESGVQIRGDRHLLSQAFANLIDNALKHAGGGEVRILVRQRCGRAEVEVSDRGPGIPPDDRETVFDRFVRLERSRSTPGNGLGLSLVRAVARRHDGAARLADNKPGLRAILELPLATG